MANHIINGCRKCTGCEKSLPISEFGPMRRGLGGLNSRCRACVRTSSRVRAQKEGRRRLLARYGLTESRVAWMLRRQGGKCAICEVVFSEIHNKKRSPFSIDHDHRTGATRGLLCDRCNLKLATLEDQEFRKRAASYLTRHNRRIAQTLKRQRRRALATVQEQDRSPA